MEKKYYLQMKIQNNNSQKDITIQKIIRELVIT